MDYLLLALAILVSPIGELIPFTVLMLLMWREERRRE